MKVDFRYLILLFVGVVGISFSAGAQTCVDAFKLTPEIAKSLANKQSLTKVLPEILRKGVVQLTGGDNQFGQKAFPHRTPADPIVFEDKKTGEVLVYGTQVDGTGFSYLKYKNMQSLLKNEKPEIVSENVYLPNGQLAKGKEAIWDTYRLSTDTLKQIFSDSELAQFYKEEGIDADSDLYFAGVALQPDGKLGRWTKDNWRRRVHVMGRKNGKLQILENPVFNKIAEGATEKDYPGFGHLSFLPGDYIGHAYGPNFKLVKNGEKTELWVISEEVTRRVNETGTPAEVTEIVARKMVSPFKASDDPNDRVLMVSANGIDGQPHPDSDRGPEMAHTKLIEGFRPTSINPEGIKITKREYVINGKRKLLHAYDKPVEAFVMAGSQGNFAGNQYDALIAVRRTSPIGEYRIATKGQNWKKYLAGLKKKYNLSWAGRPSFVQGDNGQWYMLFHAVDKDIRPDGSYGGVIPSDTETYHRNIYMVPVEFYINLNDQVDMKLLY